MAAWVISRPFHTVRSVNCGDGVYVQILCPNESAEVLHRAFYNSNGLDLKEPVEFGHMPIGSKLEIVALTSENDDYIGLIYPELIDYGMIILFNTKTGWHWPTSPDRKVDDETRLHLTAFQKSHPNIWLKDTYDGALTKPDE